MFRPSWSWQARWTTLIKPRSSLRLLFADRIGFHHYSNYVEYEHEHLASAVYGQFVNHREILPNDVIDRNYNGSANDIERDSLPNRIGPSLWLAANWAAWALRATHMRCTAGALPNRVPRALAALEPPGYALKSLRGSALSLLEGKMVLVSYHAQRNLLMSASFTVSAPTRTKQSANGQAETPDAELKDVANGKDIVDVKPIAAEVTS